MAQESRVARCRGGVGGRLWILRKTESLGGKVLLGLPKHLSGARRLLGRLTVFSLHGFISLRYCAFGRLGHRLLEGAKDHCDPSSPVERDLSSASSCTSDRSCRRNVT